MAEPKRRQIIELLAAGELPVGELVSRLRSSQPSISKHLRILREAGFVTARVDAQRRVYALDPRPLRDLDDWVGRFRPFWSARLDALERHLDEGEA